MSDFCQIQDWKLFSGSIRPWVIAGPCSVENRESLISEAFSLKKAGVRVLRGGLWKPRTHPGCFEGVGETGAQWLREAGAAADMHTATEVANARHVEIVLKNGIDAVWIGARTTGNPFLVQEIAEALRGTDTPVFVKNPMVPDPELWSGAIERFARCGLDCICAVHRGFHFYGETCTGTLLSGRYQSSCAAAFRDFLCSATRAISQDAGTWWRISRGRP